MSDTVETIETQGGTVEPKTPPTDTTEAEHKIYSAEYVRRLNEESAERRIKNKELTERVTAMSTEIEQERQRATALEAQVRELQEKAKAVETLEAEKAQLLTYKERLEAQEASQREAILAKIPEDKRESYKSLPLDALQRIEQDFLSSPIGSLGAHRGAPPKGLESADLGAMTKEQLLQLQESNPAAFAQALRQKALKIHRK